MQNLRFPGIHRARYSILSQLVADTSQRWLVENTEKYIFYAAARVTWRALYRDTFKTRTTSNEIAYLLHLSGSSVDWFLTNNKSSRGWPREHCRFFVLSIERPSGPGCRTASSCVTPSHRGTWIIIEEQQSAQREGAGHVNGYQNGEQFAGTIGRWKFNFPTSWSRQYVDTYFRTGSRTGSTFNNVRWALKFHGHFVPWYFFVVQHRRADRVNCGNYEATKLIVTVLTNRRDASLYSCFLKNLFHLQALSRPRRLQRTEYRYVHFFGPLSKYQIRRSLSSHSLQNATMHLYRDLLVFALYVYRLLLITVLLLHQTNWMCVHRP